MIALVTGVNKEKEMGLGFSVARLLAEKGFQVIITAKDRLRVTTTTLDMILRVMPEWLPSMTESR
jgi:NAD(P)-dependent dehydrogenase (short-subunit alcohol dehydrogenase family)